MSESAESLAGVDRATSVADLPPLVRIRCPNCGTETTVSRENAHDALETHDEKRHDGEQTAGLKIQTDDGFVVVPHPNDVVTDGGSSNDSDEDVFDHITADTPESEEFAAALREETGSVEVAAQEVSSDTGLYSKYAVFKDGEPVEECFVLEPSDPAAREALIRYAEETDDEALAADLREWVIDYCTDDGTDRSSSEAEHPTPACPNCGKERTRPLDDEWATCFDCGDDWMMTDEVQSEIASHWDGTEGQQDE